MHRGSVSILVVLDSPPQQCVAGSLPTAFSGFNPCCSGFASSTSVPERPRWRQRKFQSLLFWIRLLNMVGEWIAWQAIGFQSLLFWIRLLNHFFATSRTALRRYGRFLSAWFLLHLWF